MQNSDFWKWETSRESLSSIDSKDFEPDDQEEPDFDFDNIFTPNPELDEPPTQIQTDTSPWVSGFEWDEEIDIVNLEVFGNKTFWEKQREIINATKSKRDVIALIPTGGGKSLTFQLAAVTENGVTIVIMPLISLIEDQISQMK